MASPANAGPSTDAGTISRIFYETGAENTRANCADYYCGTGIAKTSGIDAGAGATTTSGSGASNNSGNGLSFGVKSKESIGYPSSFSGTANASWVLETITHSGRYEGDHPDGCDDVAAERVPGGPPTVSHHDAPGNGGRGRGGSKGAAVQKELVNDHDASENDQRAGCGTGKGVDREETPEILPSNITPGDATAADDRDSSENNRQRGDGASGKCAGQEGPQNVLPSRKISGDAACDHDAPGTAGRGGEGEGGSGMAVQEEHLEAKPSRMMPGASEPSAGNTTFLRSGTDHQRMKLAEDEPLELSLPGKKVPCDAEASASNNPQLTNDAGHKRLTLTAGDSLGGGACEGGRPGDPLLERAEGPEGEGGRGGEKPTQVLRVPEMATWDTEEQLGIQVKN